MAEHDTDHVTAVFDVPPTVAVNNCVAVGSTLTEVGVIETVTFEDFPPPPPLPPPWLNFGSVPHPIITIRTATAKTTRRLFLTANSLTECLHFASTN